MEIKRSITVNVPLETAWSVLGGDFHRVSKWACGIATSHSLSETGPAGIAHRQCVVDGMGTITEEVTHFDAASHSFAYTVIEGAPGVMKHLGNTWNLESAGEGSSTIRFCIKAEMKTIPGLMMGWMMERRMSKMCDQVCVDLKAFLETGAASEKKRAELSIAA